jgi:hypothetical protein
MMISAGGLAEHHQITIYYAELELSGAAPQNVEAWKGIARRIALFIIRKCT